jgi:hypothetical protein
MPEIIDEGGVDLNTDGLIEKRSLHEFQEMPALVLHWHGWANLTVRLRPGRTAGEHCSVGP